MSLLRMGDTGVDALQQLLIEAGFSVASEELVSGRFGMSTYDAVRQFQANHTGPDGSHLTEDGIVGPATMWALNNPHGGGTKGIVTGWRCDPSEARADLVDVLKRAVGEIGVTESPPGSNRGPRVDLYTGLSGSEEGQPWCAYFVSWCYRACAQGSPFGTIASAYKMLDWGKSNGRLVSFKDSLPGDIFVILRDNYHGHVGLICHVEGDQFSTVEGNSSNSVRGLVRSSASFGAIVRPIPL